MKPTLASAGDAGVAKGEAWQRARRRTLRLAVFLSAWAPLATGLAVAMSRSTTQVADFVRRTIELVAVVVAYAAFVRASRAPSPERAARWERTANRVVAVALLASAVAIAAVALVRGSAFRPGGNVVLGIVIALLGLITNAWFWRRYVGFERDRPSTIIGGQRVFYRAKCAVDAVVLTALSAVMLAPAWTGTRAVDLVGSLAVSAYLVWSGVRALSGTVGGGAKAEGGQKNDKVE
ncbi:MAG: cation transporter [Trueperaceae bacterium]